MQVHLKTVQLYKKAQHCVILYHIRKAVTSQNIHKTDLNELHYDISSSTDESTSACEMSTQTGNFTQHQGDDLREVCLSPFSRLYVG